MRDINSLTTQNWKVPGLLITAWYKNLKHSTGCHTSNTVIKILLDSGSDGDLLFHEKEIERHFPYLTRQVPKSWHTFNESFLKGGS